MIKAIYARDFRMIEIFPCYFRSASVTKRTCECVIVISPDVLRGSIR
jgi:hypothetical protein